MTRRSLTSLFPFVNKPENSDEGSLANSLRVLLGRHIDSVHTLEVLLALYRAKGKSLTVAEVESSIKSCQPAVHTSLVALAGAGFAKRSGDRVERFTFSPSSKDLERFTAELAMAYAERHPALIAAIYADRS